jgi:tetratricopeptide (TPR) repeat protein
MEKLNVSLWEWTGSCTAGSSGKEAMKKIALLLIVLFASCQTMKNDLFISSPKEQMELDLTKLERLIVALDKSMLEQERQNVMAAARQMAAGMEQEAEADADFAGRLAAWSGRLAILEGRYSEARRLYRRSHSLSKNNLPAIIFGIRLEGDPVKRLELVDRELALAGTGGSFASGIGELQIEKGRSLAELRRYAEAVAAFDAAFASGLDRVYVETYKEIREHSWELRNLAGTGGALVILEQGGLDWKGCIGLLKTETQLLRFLSGGKDVSEAGLFSRLLERSFIPYSQDTALGEWPLVQPRITDPVFRSGVAWLLWHLYAEARADRGLLSKYSARFASGSSPRSPIADLPPLSPFFDSILGCVETELLALPDGKNFRPAKAIPAADFLAALKKISY